MYIKVQNSKNNIRIIKPLAVFIAFILAAIACRSIFVAQENQNLSSIYNPGSTSLHPAFHVYHHQPNKSQLTIKLFPSELLFNKANPQSEYQSKVKIGYELFDLPAEGRSEVFKDSATHTFVYRLEDGDQRIYENIDISAEKGKTYLLKLYVEDMLRKTNIQSFYYVDKTSEYSQQNFSAFYEDGGNLIFEPRIVGDKIFNLKYNKPGFNKIFVKYYKLIDDLPTPTFSAKQDESIYNKPDSIWLLPYSDTLGYSLSYEGLYLFQVDTSEYGGLSMFKFHAGFPRINKPQELVDPLAYLLTSVRYQEMQKAQNQKLAVDNFWLETSDNINRSRELIRIYYNRVFLANYYFTSSKEGWKTDRGMIYIVYGQPNSLYKSWNKEQWLYYDKNKATTINFTFNKKPSPFTTNEFVLERGPNLNSHWREAILTWRNGEVYTLDN